MTTSSVTPVSLKGQTDAGRILRRGFSYLRPYWRLTTGAYVAMVFINALNLLVPQFIRWIVDRGIDGGDMRLLSWSVFGLLGLTFGKGVVSYWQGRWTEIASQGVAYDLRNAIHDKLAALSFSYHDRTETGQLLSRSVQDVERIRFLTGRALLRLVEGAVLLIGTAVVLALMNWRLALLSLLAMPLLAYRALQFGRHFRPLSLAIQQQLAVVTTRLEQNLRGARIVKAFAQEPAEVAAFAAQNRHWFDLEARSARLQALNIPLMDLIANIATVVVIWYGGILATRGTLTLGELVAFSTYLGQLIAPVRRLGMIVPALAMAAASGERIFEILDASSEVADVPDAAPMPPVRGQVQFENVSFAYFRGHKVLDNISFTAAPGQVIALLGTTGSGKSTIINLIPRFYDPTAGRILIDGHDIRQVRLASLRDQIGIVLQESTLFAASVRENIAFGRPDADEAAIIAAARAAQAHDFIMEMPDGYETRVGEQGSTLSGGQRQRLAIARALLKDPRILILDDATSSVDTETEQLIQLALQRLMRPEGGVARTSFVIAQRLSTVRMADVILVLEKGRIAAAGTHHTLLQTSPLYADIYYRQLRPSSELSANGRMIP
ncbi:MAG: ABC transporter ATP-binding protein [Ardenticatenales bacterium]|nr:ABC transporter ATP-binding protein [Ardenticatenales bacterium]